MTLLPLRYARSALAALAFVCIGTPASAQVHEVGHWVSPDS